MKKALITGITGQDGSYLTEYLLAQGYTVYGIVRRASTFNTKRLDHLYQDPHEKDVRLRLVYGDLSDPTTITRVIDEVQPDEVYNLGAQSHVRVSFDIPEYTADITGLGTLRVLEAIRQNEARTGKKIKFYQASSSEMYGKVHAVPQNEETPFHPRSPYGCAKVYAYWITRNYRESYGLFAVNGILFNHESPLRGETFVTKKITKAAAAIAAGTQQCLYLGNIDAKRDWGHARDYVEAMHLMLQQDTPDDFVVASGETHSVREFLELAFAAAGIPIKSNGKHSVDEVFTRIDTGTVVVKIDPRYYRPAEVDLLLGDPSKAQRVLGWKPKTSFKALVEEMVASDKAELHREHHGTQPRSHKH